MNATPRHPFEIPPDLSRRGIYVGTSGYYYDDWVGLFNPPTPKKTNISDAEAADQDRLVFYQKYFALVEINSTFYQEPKIEKFYDIAERSRERTKYAVKVHQDVSHTRKWDAAAGAEAIERHINTVSPLIETGRFFTFLIQTQDDLQRSQARLDYFMTVAAAAIRKHVDVHIEFRHISWHDKHVLQTLKDNGVGICNTEIPPVGHLFPLNAYATTDKGYLRLSGRNVETWYPEKKGASAAEKIEAGNARYDYLYSAEEIEERVALQIALSKKTQTIAVAYNNHYQANAVQNAIDTLKLLAKRLRVERAENRLP